METTSDVFTNLGRRIYKQITDHVAAGECTEWCDEVMEMAEELGLAKRELYDPNIHGSIDAEPGVSNIWTWRHLPKGWNVENPEFQFIDPSTGEEQMDISKRGVMLRK